MLSTVTSKGQVTIPKDIRDRLHIMPNDSVDFVVEKERVVMIPVRTLRDLRGSVKGKGSNAVSDRQKAKNAVAKRVKEEMR